MVMVEVVVVMMMMMSSAMEAKETGIAAGTGETLMVEKLRGALLSLGGAGSSPPGTGPPPMTPHDPDWLVPLGAILVVLFALACVMVYIMSRWGCCKDRTPGMSMFEHECLTASLFIVLLLVLSLASLYYLYCYRGGCYGSAVAGAASGAAGRKAKMMST